MSFYDQQIAAYMRIGRRALSKLISDNSEMFLSLDRDEVQSAVESMVRLIALDLPSLENATQEQWYDALGGIVGQLIDAGKIKPREYGYSPLGNGEAQELVALAQAGGVVTVEKRYADVVEVYRTNPVEFNRLRASDPSFLARSNEAQSLKLLTQ